MKDMPRPAIWGCLVMSGLAALVSAADNSTNTTTFDWYSIEPSDNVTWTPCYDTYKCARLTLPLDYLTPNDTRKTTIALQVLPAKDQANRKGTILINTGGPGIPGTASLLDLGATIAGYVGDTFDVLGFDPRGIGASTPRTECYDCAAERQQFVYGIGERLLNLTDDSIPLIRARENLTAQRCEDKVGGPDGIGRFVGTTSVARDMLEISRKLGQDKVMYWGFSYGSILGQYFAAMYPESVGRVIIDGVWDAYDYRNATFKSGVVGTDGVIASFFDFCHQGGPQNCSLYAPSSEKVKARFTNALATLDAEPIPVPSWPFIVTGKDIRGVIYEALYNPLASFSMVADTLAAIEARNATALAALVGAADAPSTCECAKPPLPWEVDAVEGMAAIECGDVDPRPQSPEEYAEYFREAQQVSELGAQFWGINRMRCSQWRMRAAWRYTGAFAADKTATPLLLIAPKGDPFTPPEDAARVAPRFGGARVLLQNSFGHSSLAAPSACTAAYVRAYFENGTLPDEGTVCEVDELPFVGRRTNSTEKQ